MLRVMSRTTCSTELAAWGVRNLSLFSAVYALLSHIINQWVTRSQPSLSVTSCWQKRRATFKTSYVRIVNNPQTILVSYSACSPGSGWNSTKVYLNATLILKNTRCGDGGTPSDWMEPSKRSSRLRLASCLFPSRPAPVRARFVSDEYGRIKGLRITNSTTQVKVLTDPTAYLRANKAKPGFSHNPEPRMLGMGHGILTIGWILGILVSWNTWPASS